MVFHSHESRMMKVLNTIFLFFFRIEGLDSAEAKKKAKLVAPNGCENSKTLNIFSTIEPLSSKRA